MTSIGRTIKEQEVFEEVLLRDIRHQIKERSTEMEDKDAETAPLTVFAIPSTWGGQVQTFSKGCENNKVPSIVRMDPDVKKKEPETLQDMEEEMAQGLGLMRHRLQFKTRHQLSELLERKSQRTFDKINSAALAAQRKLEDDLARVKQLAAQM